VFSSDDIYVQIIYTAGRDSQYQNTIVADAAPLITAPVILCTFTFEIFTPNNLYLLSFLKKKFNG
jgi:hypothetical protein